MRDETAERDKLRDKFAATALVVLLMRKKDLTSGLFDMCHDAYQLAELMLSERDNCEREREERK